jgi:hypothetical protein
MPGTPTASAYFRSICQTTFSPMRSPSRGRRGSPAGKHIRRDTGRGGPGVDRCFHPGAHRADAAGLAMQTMTSGHRIGRRWLSAGTPFPRLFRRSTVSSPEKQVPVFATAGGGAPISIADFTVPSCRLAICIDSAADVGENSTATTVSEKGYVAASRKVEWRN